MFKILIVGGGSFGNAMAVCCQPDRNFVKVIARSHKNFPFLKEHTLLKHCVLETFSEFSDPLENYHFILLAVPSQALREVSSWLKTKKKTGHLPKIISLAKGIERNSLLFPHQILREIWNDEVEVGALSGPSFAKEIISGLPTGVVVASKSKELLHAAAEVLHSPSFRIYPTQDIVGVETGGALKNIVAILAGAVDGLKLGHNTRSSVMTWGLRDMAEIGTQLGANPMTFLGLSGVGDLILTCTGELSRNRQFGYRLALGESSENIITSMGGVIEGVDSTHSAYKICQKLGVEASLFKALYQVLYENLPIQQALSELMNTAQSSEFTG